MNLLSLLSFRGRRPGFRGWRSEASSPVAGRIVLALGGGGARGLSHLGVVRAVNESGLPLQRIVGVSMGALAGGLCAVEGNPRKAAATAIDYIRSDDFRHQHRVLTGAQPATAEEQMGGLFSWYDRLKRFVQAHRKLGRAVSGPALLSDTLLREAVETLLPDIGIEETEIPLSVVAADLRGGHRVVLETGSLRQAVLASMAIPGIFPPVEYRGMLLCDIGVLDSVPIDVARSYPHDVSVGVDVGQGHSTISGCSTAIDVMMRVDELGERMFRRHTLDNADLVIRPDVEGVAWFDFSRADELVRSGYVAARDALAKIRHLRVA